MILSLLGRQTWYIFPLNYSSLASQSGYLYGLSALFHAFGSHEEENPTPLCRIFNFHRNALLLAYLKSLLCRPHR